MFKIRKENRIVKDDHGYVHGCVAAIEESKKQKNSINMMFKIQGTEGEIPMRLFPTIVVSNRKGEDGRYNLMTQLCLNFGFITEDQLKNESFDVDHVNTQFMGLEGQAVKFKTVKQEVTTKKGDKKTPTLEQIDVGTLELLS